MSVFVRISGKKNDFFPINFNHSVIDFIIGKDYVYCAVRTKPYM